MGAAIRVLDKKNANKKIILIVLQENMIESSGFIIFLNKFEFYKIINNKF
jgi:hypothetical protein